MGRKRVDAGGSKTNASNAKSKAPTRNQQFSKPLPIKIAELKTQVRSDISKPTRARKRATSRMDAFEARDLQVRLASLELRERKTSGEGSQAEQEALRQAVKDVGKRLKRAKTKQR